MLEGRLGQERIFSVLREVSLCGHLASPIPYQPDCLAETKSRLLISRRKGTRGYWFRAGLAL